MEVVFVCGGCRDPQFSMFLAWDIPTTSLLAGMSRPHFLTDAVCGFGGGWSCLGCWWEALGFIAAAAVLHEVRLW